MNASIEVAFEKKTGTGKIDGVPVIWVEKSNERGRYLICQPNKGPDIVYCDFHGAVDSAFHRFESLAMWTLKKKAKL